MAILKCKMCGGDIELSADKTFGTCDSCGSTMTFPKVDDEQRANRFNRGNQFRRAGEFDKALAVYEQIVQEDENDAEAHWCCALCRFGIEYVEDPNTFEYLPTCHRASFDSFLEDVDYLAAVEHSEGITRRQYQKDAAKIAEVQRGILATSQNEEPFDVFICYKESENDNSRTRDSLLAQDIYYQLTEQGRRVFFSRITLEDKAGTEYEPYIFAALNSAKVMIVVTTSAEHVNAVWVKNEWSRFLSLMRKDRSKLLLPCYRDMDPYDLPEALSVLQSYDMGKIGFIQDLIRGVNKVLDAEKPKESVKETIVVQQQTNANAAPLLKRAFIFLEDGDFSRADEFCEQVLNIDPENAEAYLGKLMAELKVRKRDDLKDQPQPFDDRNSYQKAMRFGDDALKDQLTNYNLYIRERIYSNGIAQMNNGDEIAAIQSFGQIQGYKNADKLQKDCIQRNEIKRKKRAKCITQMNKYTQSMICVGRQIGNEDALALGVQSNGTVIANRDITAENRSILKWEKIVALSAGCDHYVGLKSDGTVVADGEKDHFPDRYNVSKWKNIIAIAAGWYHTVGLQSDGRVVTTATLLDMNTSEWNGVIAITAGEFYTIGLRYDGTVYTTNEFTLCKDCGLETISRWTNIVSIVSSHNFTIGLKTDGTVVAAGKNDHNQCNVYMNCKSNKYCSIYLIGYSEGFQNKYSDAISVKDINLQNELQYSDTCFIDACDSLKKRLKHWSYSGEPELIILQNSSVDNPRSQLDFSNYIYVDINYGLQKGYLDSFPRFMERLLEAAKQEVTAKEAVTTANRKRMKARNIIEFALEQDEKLPKPLKKILTDKSFYKSYRG